MVMTAGVIDSQSEPAIADLVDNPINHRSKPCIVIGVCTRQRNALLRRLINSVWAQPIPNGYNVELLVIDNNDRPLAAEAFVGLSDRFPIRVVHEPRAGLVFARNRALDEAATYDADWFIGLDDDEWVGPQWLPKFIAGIETMARPILIAPCRYVYDRALSPFLEPIQLAVMPRGKRPAVLASSNFAIHRRIFDPAHGLGLRFDPTFNESGSEDVEFFLRAERLHGWIAASLPDAVAYEDWNGERATLRYRLSRSMRNQVSTFQVAHRHLHLGYHGSRVGNFTNIVMRVNRHAVYGCVGLLAGLMVLPVRKDKGQHLIGRALERCARALAVFPFILGASPVAYGARVKAR
jgi:glycosyltransferase involved in cell wall biosynthesis